MKPGNFLFTEKIRAGLRYIHCISYGCLWGQLRYIFRHRKDYGYKMCLISLKNNFHNKHNEYILNRL